MRGSNGWNLSYGEVEATSLPTQFFVPAVPMCIVPEGELGAKVIETLVSIPELLWIQQTRRC